MIFRMPSGSNAGSSGGGAPTGSAGGSLTGTYPNPTIATIPSGATATTQSAADNSTKVATTAYTDTGLALKANLAGPTFTGVVTLPTGTVATTQSAADNSTKLGTTAYIDTADNLKANIASPTFTGHPVGVSETAGTNSTRLATTLYADRAVAGGNVATSMPQDHGWLAWNQSLQILQSGVGTSNVTANGVQTLAKIMTPTTLSVTNIVFFLSALGGTATVGQNFVGLYGSDGTRLGISADQATAWGSGGSTGLKTVALASGPFSTAGYAFVWVAFLPNTGGSVAGFSRCSANASAYINLGLTTANYFACSNGSSKTALDSPIVPANNVVANSFIWCALS